MITKTLIMFSSYFKVVRSSLPRLDLDDAFSSKDEIAQAVKAQLGNLMAEYGYEILVALVTDLDPDKSVKNAMNEINGTYFTLKFPFN